MTGTDIDRLRLHVRYDEGAGPVMVFLHGINSDGTDWRPVIDRIGPGYRCIALDLLGFGESPKPVDIEYSADEHARVVAATVRELGVKERFVLVGYSLGGDVAVRYASTYPDTLRRLFLLSAPFYPPAETFTRRTFGPEFFQELLFQGVWNVLAGQKERGGAVYSLASGRLEQFAKGFLRTDDVSEHWDIMSKNLTNTIGAATFVDDLPRLTMPVVFALGVRDPIVRPDQTPTLKRLKPDIEIRRIVGLTADHFMLMNIPERVADEILADEVRSLHVTARIGSGIPTLLLHGIEDDSGRWAPFAAGLAASGADVVTVDLLGFGSSPAPVSSHYTLEDHAAAALGTARDLFGSAPVRLIGHGFGALVALEAAAERPDGVAEVIACAPPLVPPGMRAADFADDPVVARALGARDSLRELSRDARVSALEAEDLERRIVPAARSLDSLLAADAESLLGRVQVPVRFVIPSGADADPWRWLADRASTSATQDIVTVDAPSDAVYTRPAEVLAALGTGEAAVRAAGEVSTVERTGSGRLVGALGSLSAQFARRGALMVLGGLPLLLWPRPIPPDIITLGLGVWLLVEALQTIAGAFGLRRAGKGWLPWLLIGGVSALFAVAVARRETFGEFIAGLVILGWLIGRAIADLYVAVRAKRLPMGRWALVLEGVASLALVALMLTQPAVGGRLFRFWLGGYLTAVGVGTLAFAWAIGRKTRNRILALAKAAATS